MTAGTVAAGEVLSLARRQVSPDPEKQYIEVGVRSFGRGLFHKPPTTGVDIGNKRVFKIEPGDLVISNVFAWEGAVGRADEGDAGTIGSHRFMTWVPDTSVLDVDYVRYFLTSEAGVSRLAAASPGSAGRNRTLSIHNFKRIEIPLPTMDEQRRVATYLTGVEEAARQFGATATSRSAWLGALGQCVMGGEEMRLSDLVQPVCRPVAVHADEAYSMLGMRWYGGGLFVRERKLGRDLSAKTVYRVAPGDLVYNRLFAWKRSFGLADATVQGTVSNEFPCFRIDRERVHPRYLLSRLLDDDFTRQVNEASTGSTPTSRNRLKEDAFLSLTVRVPDMSAQEQAVRVLEGVDALHHLEGRSKQLVDALLSAARNEVFNAMA